MTESTGPDPVQRVLRILSLLCFLGLFILVVVDPDRADNLPLIGVLVGAILVQLGYDAVVSLPFGMKRHDRD